MPKVQAPLTLPLPLPLSKPPPSHPSIVTAALSLLSPLRLFLTQHPESSRDNLKQITSCSAQNLTVAPYSIHGQSRSSYQGPSVIRPWFLFPLHFFPLSSSLSPFGHNGFLAVPQAYLRAFALALFALH